MKNDQYIPCPVCGTKMPIDIMQLLKSEKLKCPNKNCNAMITLQRDNAKSIVENTLEKLDKLKGNLNK